MPKSDRQKYNFLAAFVKQLDNALDEQDELAGQCQEVMGVMELVRSYAQLDDRIRKCEQWLAQLESALEELDDSGSSSSGEEPDEDDDGDDDDDAWRDEPPMGSQRQPDGRLAAAVDRAGEGRSNRRPVSPEVSKVRIGSGKRSKT